MRDFKRRVAGSGISVGHSEKLSNMRYADDILLYANSAEEAIHMLGVLVQELGKRGLSLNASKTNIVTNDTDISNSGDGARFDFAGEQLTAMTDKDYHKYLGRKFSGDLRERTTCNVNYRMECAWTKYHANSRVLANTNISLRLRLRLFDAVVTPTAVYGLSSNGLTDDHRRRIGSARRLMLRKVVGYTKLDDDTWEDAGRRSKLKIQWTMDNVYMVSDWLQNIARARWRLVHKSSLDRDSWPSIVMRWMPDKVRRRGRPRMRWHDSIDAFLSGRGTSLHRALQSRDSFQWANYEQEYVDYMNTQ